MVSSPAMKLSYLLLLVAVFSLVLLESCSSEKAPSQSETSEYELGLIENFQLATRWFEPAVIRPGAFADRRYLASGWNFPVHKTDDEEGASMNLWIDAPAARVRLPIAETADRKLTFRLKPPTVPHRLHQRMQVSLNGVQVADRLLPRANSKQEVVLPASLQVQGINRLQFDFARSVRLFEHSKTAKDYRYMSASMGSLKIEILDSDVRSNVEEARSFVANGAELSGDENARVLNQVSGSELFFPIQVPPSGAFVSEIYASGEGTNSQVFQVWGKRDNGARELLAEKSTNDGDSQIRADLSSFEDEFLILELRVKAADGSGEACVGSWFRPRVVGSAPPVMEVEQPSTESERLAKLKSELKGAPVIGILLDAFNPLFLEAYGGSVKTPALSAFANEGVVFKDAYGEAAYTVASVGSMLTSKYTWEHGAWQGRVHHMLSIMPTWPSAFSSAGYRSAAIMMSVNGSSMIGFDRGFDQVIDSFDRIDDHPVPLAEQALPALAQVLDTDDDRPLFLWMHLVEPHEPYDPPTPWESPNRSEYSGAVDGESDTLWAIKSYRILPSEKDLGHIRSLYSDNLRYVDDVFSRIQKDLESKGIWQEAVIILFSDHGEAFLDHHGKSAQTMGHGTTVYEDMVRIPLIVRLPEKVAHLVEPGRSASGIVSGLDLLPTAADLVGLGEDAVVGAGKSFSSMLVGEDSRRSAAVFHSSSFTSQRFLPSLGMRLGRYKVISTPGESPEIFDINVDPLEQRNLAPEQPALCAYLVRRLREESKYNPETSGWGLPTQGGDEEMELDAETLEQLRALGYVR